jgi:hypothetical protein
MQSGQPTRQELIEAREDLEHQIQILKYPANWWDRNPALVARLEGLLGDVTQALADTDSQAD